MEHQNRLTYCKFCKNRLFVSSQGLLCGLTNSKAKFALTCNDFLKDFEELDKARKGNGAYRIIGDTKTEYIFPYLTLGERQKNTVDVLKIHKKVFTSWELYTWFFLSISISPMILAPLFGDTNLIWIIVAVILGVGVIYLRHKFKNKVSLIINKNGIIQDKKVITTWDNVIRFYLTSSHDINYNAPILSRTIKTLVIEKFGNTEEILIDITSYGLNLSKLGKQIEIITTHNTQYSQ